MNAARALLDTLPDLPRWVELRAGLLGGEAVVYGPAHACVVRWVERDGFATCAAVGRPKAGPLREALRASPDADLLVSPDDHPHAASLLGAPGRCATLHRLAGGAGAEAPAGTRLLGPDDAPLVAALPEADLRAELLAALARGPMAAAFEGARPVAFCYAGAVTATLWDVSIDTLEGWRRRGFAGRAARAMIAHMRARGREPVWAAYDDNPASLDLARKLGFAPVDRLFVFEAAGRRLAGPLPCESGRRPGSSRSARRPALRAPRRPPARRPDEGRARSARARAPGPPGARPRPGGGGGCARQSPTRPLRRTRDGASAACPGKGGRCQGSAARRHGSAGGAGAARPQRISNQTSPRSP